jgi:hypothetical protein
MPTFAPPKEAVATLPAPAAANPAPHIRRLPKVIDATAFPLVEIAGRITVTDDGTELA